MFTYARNFNSQLVHMFNLPQNGFKYATDRRASRRGTEKPKKNATNITLHLKKVIKKSNHFRYNATDSFFEAGVD